MAVFGIEIRVATADSADSKQEIFNQILSVLQDYTVSHVSAAAYSAGSGSTNQMSVDVTSATVDYAIRVLMEQTTFGTTEVASVLRKVLGILDDGERVLIPTGGTYAAGTRAYNHTLTLT